MKRLLVLNTAYNALDRNIKRWCYDQVHVMQKGMRLRGKRMVKSASRECLLFIISIISKMGGWTCHLILTLIVIGFGSSFQHGYNIGVINAPQTAVEAWITRIYHGRYSETPSRGTLNFIYSVIVSITSIGGMIGALMTAYVAERFGRKGGLFLNNVFIFIAAILMGLCKTTHSYEMLIAGRFFVGINSGSSVLKKDLNF